MTRLLVTSASAIFLILFVAFVASRLVRSRTAGLSIRLQLFLALASIVGAFAVGLGLLVLDRLEARTTLIAEGAARDEAEAIAALVASEIESRGVAFDEIARKYSTPPPPAPTGRADPRTKRGLALLDPAGRAMFSTGLMPDEPGTVFVVAPVAARGAIVGGVRVVKPTIVVRRLVEDFAPFVLVVSLVLGITAALAANQSGRAIARPIEALTDFAVHVSEGERRAVPPPVHGREVQRLSRAIDSMRRQIEGRPFVETFAADLSHELKNPVAAIRASAEVLADGALDEPEEAARFVGRIQEATTRIDALLGDLLSLARIEARGVEEATALDLGDVAGEAARRARDRGDRVDLDVGGNVAVRGDARWLARALDNLLDNARAHGDEGHVVRVVVRRDRERGVVVVENDGEIHDHVKKRLFRRFATTREGKGGTGLGLAIVRAIVEAHGGSVECTHLGPPRVAFAIALPIA